MSKHQGSLELVWTDKDKTLLSRADGRYDYTFVDPSDHRASEVRLLHPVEQVDAPTPAERPGDLPAPTTGNLLITGDSMHALDALAKIPEYADTYLGKVALVYIDPPFNTGQAFHHYEDNIEHSVWLTMLRDRLAQIKPLLAPNGTVWVHLDDAEVHRCRAVMDEQLGIDNFINQVVWKRTAGKSSARRGMGTMSDTILVYGASPSAALRPVFGALSDKHLATEYRHVDERGRHMLGDLTAPGARTGDSGELWRGRKPGGRNRHWAAPTVAGVTDGDALSLPTRQRLDLLDAAGYIHWPEGAESVPKVKRYLEDSKGVAVGDVWDDIARVANSSGERRDYDTQKPEELLKRVISMATAPGDIVLDCFAGSGTTAATAHKMGRRWVTTELLTDTVDTYIKPRLREVVEGKDHEGITVVTEIVEVLEQPLPAGVTVRDALSFQRVLRLLLADAADAADPATPDADSDQQYPLTVDVAAEMSKMLRAASRASDSDVTRAEAKAALDVIRKLTAARPTTVDITKPVRSELNRRTRTREVTTQLWHGGGGFTHLKVGPSMFVEVAGMILLADWAVHGDLARAMCAQLGVRYRPEGIFSAHRGRTRYVVLDGMVGEATVASILDRLPDGEIVEVWATQIESGTADVLRAARPGSKLRAIPAAVLDNYRRKTSKATPFGGRRSAEAPEEARS